MSESPHVDEAGLELDDLGEKLEAFYALRNSGSVEADAALDRLGADDDTDREIMLELAARRPLGVPDRFPEAHALVVRSLEVLDRNGTRGIDISPRLGPLRPVAKYLVALVTRFIVRNYLRSVINNLRELYTRREANCLVNDPARPMLTRARIHADRLTEGFKKNPLGVPSFLLGGAVLSFLLGALQDAVDLFSGSGLATIILSAAVIFVFGGASWVIIKGAAIARRRIKISTEKPLVALYQCIGMAGNPPKDSARDLAFLAILALAIGFFAVPILIGLIIL